MALRIGINGLGRIGRLTLRILWQKVSTGDVELVRINDPGGDAATFAHLFEFDSVHGHWSPGKGITAADDAIVFDGKSVAFSANKAIADSDWSGCDVVIECSGKMKTTEKLQAYLDQGVGRVVVSAPMKEASVLNVVVGVNPPLSA